MGRWITKNGRHIYIKNKYRRPPRRKVIVKKPPTAFNKDLTEEVIRKTALNFLKPALIYGIATAFPSASFLIPAYKLYTYSKFGVLFYQFNENISKSDSEEYRKEIIPSFIKMSESYGEITSKPLANVISKKIVSSAEKSGIINTISQNTGVDEKIYTKMLEGTIEDGISNTAGNLTSFAIGSVI